jgi:hypothetical protein
LYNLAFPRAIDHNIQYRRFVELDRRYREWLQDHRRPYRPRARTEHIRDIGEATGPWDDNPEGEDDDYEDDGFVVPDNEDGDEEQTGDEEDKASDSESADSTDSDREESEAMTHSDADTDQTSNEEEQPGKERAESMTADDRMEVYSSPLKRHRSSSSSVYNISKKHRRSYATSDKTEESDGEVKYYN